ncbi:hypothetical protein ACFLQX_00285 [Bacteroidota bacterium]
MARKRLLYYGLQRSGTNFLAKVIQQQFEVEFLNKRYIRSHPRHKHFRIYDNKELIGRENYHNTLLIEDLQDFENKLEISGNADGFIILSKDPYSWLISYKKWAKRMKWSDPPHPYILEYNEFYRKWWELSLQSEKVIFLRYEDLLMHTHEVLNNLSDKFELDRLPSEFIQDEQIKRVPYSAKFTSKNLKYYSRKKYLKKYSNKELKVLNALIDHDLIKNLGYKSYF